MAQSRSTSIATELFISRVEHKTLTEAVKEYFKVCGQGFALLYSPKAAYLARLESDNRFVVSPGKEPEPTDFTEQDWRYVFEARVFNETAELRWLNRENGKGAVVVLCEDDSLKFFDVNPEALKTTVEEDGELKEKELVGTVKQTYLIWGQSAGASEHGWTRSAEARIGSFFVPLSGVTAEDLKQSEKPRAQFTVVEYLGAYEDGNVAVAEERLLNIELA